MYDGDKIYACTGCDFVAPARMWRMWHRSRRIAILCRNCPSTSWREPRKSELDKWICENPGAIWK